MKKMAIVFCLMVFSLAVIGCEQEGSAEKAGKEIDKAVDSFKSKLHEATR